MSWTTDAGEERKELGGPDENKSTYRATLTCNNVSGTNGQSLGLNRPEKGLTGRSRIALKLQLSGSGRHSRR
jgi:hypothetical protein